MKGFIHLIEVAIAAILFVIALTSFLATRTVALHWERSDLISHGDSVLHTLSASNRIAEILVHNTTDIDALMPYTVKYAVRVMGAPKPNISVGCVGSPEQCSGLRGNLTPTFYNGRFVNFTVTRVLDFSLPALEAHDVLIFRTMPVDGFDGNATVQEYLKRHGIVALLDVTDANLAQLDWTFNLSKADTPPPSMKLNYAPGLAVPRYFLGFGMNVPTPDTVDGNRAGVWRIWETAKNVNITPDMRLVIEGIGAFAENEVFMVKAADGRSYAFRVKKIWPDRSGSIIQPLNMSFVFENFAAELAVSSNTMILEQAGSSAATVNGSAIWISDWAVYSDEYGLLLRAATSSLATEWWAAEPLRPREPVTVSAFVNTCCDMPETVELILWLWYIF